MITLLYFMLFSKKRDTIQPFIFKEGKILSTVILISFFLLLNFLLVKNKLLEAKMITYSDQISLQRKDCFGPKLQSHCENK